MSRLALAAALLAFANPALAQENQITAYSDASYPQEWRLVHDYWFNTTTFLDDARTFHVRIDVPSAGTYVWTMPSAGGIQPDLSNPLARLFAEFRITLEGTTWDLAADNTTSPFPADGLHDLVFTVSYRIAKLSPYQYTSILEDTHRVRDAERAQWPDGNIVSRPNEASGFIRLKQVTAEGQAESCAETCAGLTQLAARDFNLVFNLIGKAFQLTFHQAQEFPVTGISGGRLAAEGSAYTSNAAFEATFTGTGNITRKGLAVALDAPTGPVVAQLYGSHSSRAMLPAGSHRFYYLFDSGDSGSVSVHTARSATGIRDDFTYRADPSIESWFVWIAIGLAAAVILALAARRQRYTWVEYDPGRLYLVVDERGRKPNREHHGRAPPLVRIRQPYDAG